MPKETDQERLDLLARVLLGAIGFVSFDERAHLGNPNEPDDLGLIALFGENTTYSVQRTQLRDVLVDFLRGGERPSRVEFPGDREYAKDPETRYEFRLDIAGRGVYVKTMLRLDDPDDPELVVKSVKKWN